METEKTKVIVYGIITDPVGWVQKLSVVLQPNYSSLEEGINFGIHVGHCITLRGTNYDCPTLHKTHIHTTHTH